MYENLKKTSCDQDCPKCPVLRLLQLRVGNNQVTNSEQIAKLASHLQEERCPDSATMDTSSVHRANPSARAEKKLDKRVRQGVWWR